MRDDERQVAVQQAQIQRLNHQRDKAKAAYYADAMEIDEFRADQQRSVEN